MARPPPAPRVSSGEQSIRSHQLVRRGPGGPGEVRRGPGAVPARIRRSRRQFPRTPHRRAFPVRLRPDHLLSGQSIASQQCRRRRRRRRRRERVRVAADAAGARLVWPVSILGHAAAFVPRGRDGGGRLRGRESLADVAHVSRRDVTHKNRRTLVGHGGWLAELVCRCSDGRRHCPLVCLSASPSVRPSDCPSWLSFACSLFVVCMFPILFVCVVLSVWWKVCPVWSCLRLDGLMHARASVRSSVRCVLDHLSDSCCLSVCLSVSCLSVCLSVWPRCRPVAAAGRVCGRGASGQLVSRAR